MANLLPTKLPPTLAKRILFALTAVLTLTLLNTRKSFAQQQNNTELLKVAYIKLKSPAFAQEYETITKQYIHARQTAANNRQRWYTWKVIIPSGTSAEYDYINITTVKSVEEALNDSGGSDIEGIHTDSTASILARLNSISTLVKKEIYTILLGDDNLQPTRYVNLSFIKPTSIDAEKTLWERENKKKSKAGEIASTQLAEKQFPQEGDALYDVISVTTLNDINKIINPKKYISGKYFTVNESRTNNPTIDPTTLYMNTERQVVKSDVLKLIAFADIKL